MLKILIPLIVVLSACTATSSGSGSTQEVPDPPSSQDLAVDCIDVTGSLESTFPEDIIATKVIPEVVEHSSQEGEIHPLVRYVRRVGLFDTFGPAGEVYAFDIPGVAAAPEGNSNVFASNEEEQVAEEEEIEAQRATVATVTETQVAELQATEIQRNDDVGSDIKSCLLKAQELLDVEDANQRRILIASDLEEFGPQPDESLLDLTGIDVEIVFQCTREAGICREIKDKWVDTLEGAGVKSIRFIDPSQIGVA